MRRGHRRIRPSVTHQIGRFIDERVVASGNDKCLLNIVDRTQETHCNILPGLITFNILRNVNNTIRFHERGDDTRAAQDVYKRQENGLFTKEELGGIEATWGNGDSIVALTELICKNEGIGQVLIKGTRYAADHLGKGHEYLVVASGIEEPQHDGRLAYGVTRTYQYDPTPGRHVKGGLGLAPVSYTHLDVYKRQIFCRKIWQKRTRTARSISMTKISIC